MGRSCAHGNVMSFGDNSSDGSTTPQPRSSELTKRILVVEDDPSVQRALKHLFEREGLAVDTYSDGRAGLDSFHAHAPSATILDLNLPELSGRTLCREMKATAPSIPIIVLSASSDLHDKVALLEMGADDYLTKAFSPGGALARARAELVEQVCSERGGDTNARSIDNHVMKLLHKFELDPGCPTHFQTVPRM